MKYYCENVFDCERNLYLISPCAFYDYGEMYCLGKYFKVNMTEFEFKMRLKIKEKK